MSNPSPASPKPVSPKIIAYLTEQLTRHPQIESSQIVGRRAKAFRLAPKTAPVASKKPAAEQRPKLLARINRIREECFQSPVEPLLATLDKMPLDEYPDLQALAARLRVVLRSRGKLPALLEDSRFDGDFFSCLKKILTSPAREVSILREQIVASFSKRKNRRRGKAMVRLLKEQLPELYALERDWFESLERRYVYSASRQVTGDVVQGTTSTESSNGIRGVGWILVILVLVGLRVARQQQNKQPTNSTPRSIPQRYTDAVPSPQSMESGRKSVEEWESDFDERVRGMQERSDNLLEEMRERHRARRDDSFPSSGENSRLPGGFQGPRTLPMPDPPSFPAAPRPGGIPRPGASAP